MRLLVFLLVCLLSFCDFSLIYPTHANAQITRYLTKSIVKKTVKKTAKKTAKKSAKSAIKKTVKKEAAVSTRKAIVKQSTNFSARKLITSNIGKEVLQKMTKEQQELFLKKGYRQLNVKFRGKAKKLLVSKDFDPNLKISREYTGDWDPVKYHRGDPRYVKDGCETNLGRMKRGFAPVYKDPTNKSPKCHGYSEFDLHHGGQKADPDYLALMGKEHETHSKILHTKSKGQKSEINRAEFNSSERPGMYKEWAKELGV